VKHENLVKRKGDGLPVASLPLLGPSSEAVTVREGSVRRKRRGGSERARRRRI
jgi:hypothetical protein